MLDADLVQGSPEWRLARKGSPGSSEVPDIVRKVQSGKSSAMRKNLLARKLCERLSDEPLPTYQSKAMLDGQVREAEARSTYSYLTGNEVELIGLVRHPLIPGAHASPDGLIGSRGLTEFKCPEHAQHLDMVLNGVTAIERDYFIQVQWQLACTGRHWCDFVSYHPDFPPALQLFVHTIERDPEFMLELETEVRKFVDELDAKVAALTERFHLEAA